MAPKNLPVRPTTDMAKEALFNILNNRLYFPDLSVLDLFSGTGNISYEFASRGAAKIVAVDADQGCTRFIGLTATTLELPILSITGDALAYLEKSALKFNLIFADPPYDLPLSDYEKIPTLAFAKQLLLEDGLLIVEHSKHMDLSHLGHYVQSRKYSGTVFSFFENNTQ